MMRVSDGDGWLSANQNSGGHLKAEPKMGPGAPDTSPSRLHGDCFLLKQHGFRKAVDAPVPPANDLIDQFIPPRRSSIQVQKEIAGGPKSPLLPGAQATHLPFQRTGQDFVVNSLNDQFPVSQTFHTTSNGTECPSWNHTPSSLTARTPWQDGPFSPNPPSSDTDLPIPMSKVRPAAPHAASSTKPFSASDTSLALRVLGDYIAPANVFLEVGAIPAERNKITPEDADQGCRVDSFSTVGSHEGHHHTAAVRPVSEQLLPDVTQLYPEPLPEHSLAECIEYPIPPDKASASDAALPVSDADLGPPTGNEYIPSNPIGQRSLSLGSLLDYSRTSQ
jgi:hypothetical protein